MESESISVPLKTWTMLEADPEDKMTLHVMLRHEASDVEKLKLKLAQVSDPRSPQYKEYLTLAQVGQMVPISESKIEAVRSFFGDAMAEMRLTPNKDIMSIVIRVKDVERLLLTDIIRFVHLDTQMTVLRANASYSLPQSVAEVVYTIGDLLHLPAPMSPIRSKATGLGGSWDNACPGLSGCKGLITPAVLKERYNVPNDTTGMTATTNSMAVAEFQGQYYKPEDLKKFGEGCGINVTVDTDVGKNKDSAGVESELDIEYIKGVAPGIPLSVFYSQEYSLLNWMTQVNGIEDAPLVHSVSYGNDEKQQTSTEYMISCNVQFMKAGVRGISVLFASGDQGVCGRSGCGIFSKHFNPDFPAGSPYITSVGGTDFVGDEIGDETAWKSGGGGFSDTFGIPDWQADLVAAYKADPDAKLPPQHMWNNTGRGYPDVSALGGQKASYCVVTRGLAQGVAGTSASCPTAASIFSRVNGVLLAAGKKPLGFLNPFIYQNGAAFNDVTSGCNSAGQILNKECFTAIKGWDAATGMGTPNFGALSKAAIAASA